MSEDEEWNENVIIHVSPKKGVIWYLIKFILALKNMLIWAEITVEFMKNSSKSYKSKQGCAIKQFKSQ